MFTLRVDNEIKLELFQPQHAHELFRLVDMNRHHLRTWLPWIDDATSPAYFYSLIPVWIRQFTENNGLSLGIRYKGHLVGNIMLSYIDWYNRQTAIGYFLAENAQGHGIMTRTVQAMINYVFIELNLNRIEIRCGEKNGKSRSIPERLGFTLEGRIRDGENLYGQYHDLFVYGLLAKDWARKNHF